MVQDGSSFRAWSQLGNRICTWALARPGRIALTCVTWPGVSQVSIASTFTGICCAGACWCRSNLQSNVQNVTHCSSLIVSGSWCEHLNIFEYAKNQELTAEFLHSISNIFQTVAQGRSFCPASEAPRDASCECCSSTWQSGWSAPCEVIASWFWGLTQEFTWNTEIPKLRLWHPEAFWRYGAIWGRLAS